MGSMFVHNKPGLASRVAGLGIVGCWRLSLTERRMSRKQYKKEQLSEEHAEHNGTNLLFTKVTRENLDPKP